LIKSDDLSLAGALIAEALVEFGVYLLREPSGSMEHVLDI